MKFTDELAYLFPCIIPPADALIVVEERPELHCTCSVAPVRRDSLLDESGHIAERPVYASIPTDLLVSQTKK